jgi:hypothetical protein
MEDPRDPVPATLVIPFVYSHGGLRADDVLCCGGSSTLIVPSAVASRGDADDETKTTEYAVVGGASYLDYNQRCWYHRQPELPKQGFLRKFSLV